MRLTSYADYSVRVLIYLAAAPGRYVSTEEISRAYNISNNHLVKVVNNLGRQGFIKVKRGRNGGILLGRNAEDINIGKVIRGAEPDFYVAECFNGETNSCPITGVCGLRHIFHEAAGAFLATLDKYTLADVVDAAPSQGSLLTALGLGEHGSNGHSNGTSRGPAALPPLTRKAVSS